MQAEEQIQTSTEVKPLGQLLEYQDSSIVSRDLDAVFRSTTGSIYASGSGRKVAPSTYQEVIRRHPTFRAKYNQTCSI